MSHIEVDPFEYSQTVSRPKGNYELEENEENTQGSFLP
jgi:hypothetical protein